MHDFLISLSIDERGIFADIYYSSELAGPCNWSLVSVFSVFLTHKKTYKRIIFCIIHFSRPFITFVNDNKRAMVFNMVLILALY